MIYCVVPRELEGELYDKLKPLTTGKAKSAHDKAVGRLDLTKPVSREAIRDLLFTTSIKDGTLAWWCLKRDIPPPFDFIASRPHQRYTMGTMMHMQAGPGLGTFPSPWLHTA